MKKEFKAEIVFCHTSGGIYDIPAVQSDCSGNRRYLR